MMDALAAAMGKKRYFFPAPFAKGPHFFRHSPYCANKHQYFLITS